MSPIMRGRSTDSRFKQRIFTLAGSDERREGWYKVWDKVLCAFPAQRERLWRSRDRGRATGAAVRQL